jgi:hypothetical protein
MAASAPTHAYRRASTNVAGVGIALRGRLADVEELEALARVEARRVNEARLRLADGDYLARLGAARR